MEISLENVDYSYETYTSERINKVLEDINLNVYRDKWISVIGHTGSGKSTLVKLIKGLLTPTTGKIRINNTEIINSKNKKLSVIHQIGFVFQYPEHQLFETTVLKDISFGPNNLGWKYEDILEKAKEVIKLVGLSEEYFGKSPFQLSGGEKRRVAIAGVLIMDPKILILDEPTAGLDPLGRQKILALVDQWKMRENTTVILITHQMNDVAEYSDEVIVMNQGVILYQTDPLTLFNNYEKELNEVGLELPDYMKLLHGINKKVDRKIEIQSIKEKDVMHKIVEYFNDKEKNTDD
ncbi:energy-coupling factor transporter ATPase [Virgibacillus dokdonensis]|uniref:Energy-coupling factor transporter ATP-binding protein EcfA2 n=1 Tax=Virgibacillus dokdonensis TaxID=302167 RepID=A0A2K9IWI0_9BACI|nr:energy-coupling factor transporter ATPase [Virgibacillus dokdonensis]AUJ24126.1 Energy-coupling factor transporter ATP-binding protein EcfA2 [Virgibacillus dokdonensis]